MAVFPGEQGGPHTQKFAAMAVAFKIAQTEAFRRLQWQIKENAAALAEGLRQRGLELAYGGTDTHFCMLDLNSVKTKTGFPLRGEPAVRILDLAGIVANKNTIPGDQLTALAMGIRLGTPWLTQRGFGAAEMDEVAGLIHQTVTNIQPFSYIGLSGELPRGKIDLDVLEEIKAGVDALAAAGRGRDRTACGTGYPHYYRLGAGAGRSRGAACSRRPDPERRRSLRPRMRAQCCSTRAALRAAAGQGRARRAGACNRSLTSDVAALEPGQCQMGFVLDADARVIDDVFVMRLPADEAGRDQFLLRTQPENHERVKAWLRGLGDGYTLFDREDLSRQGRRSDDRRGPGPGAGRKSALVSLAVHGPQGRRTGGRGRRGLTGAQLHPSGRPCRAGRAGRLSCQEDYDRLVAAGITPASAETLAALREASGLPDYSRYPGYGPDSGRPTGLELYQNCHHAALRAAHALLRRAASSLDPVRSQPDLPDFQWQEPEERR